MQDIVVLKPSEVAQWLLQKSKMPPKGTALASKKEWKTAHRTEPKEYRSKKAGRVYLDEEGHRYPVGDAKHVRDAASRLANKKNASYFPKGKLSEMKAKLRQQAKKDGVHLAGTKE